LKKGLVKNMPFTNEQIDELAKEACWYDGGGKDCKGVCATCKAGHYKKFKRLIKVVIPKWEKIRGK